MTVNAAIESDAPAPIAVVDAAAIAARPGANLDDRLRLEPGFTLFRRTSSLVANPTTQGVSLRGIGSSGASRTLVLWDALPLNSPFGGWVYWTRVAPSSIERIEIVETPSTSVFGDRALAGVVSMFTRVPATDTWHFDAAYSNGANAENDASLDVTARVGKRWAVSVDTRQMHTDGYYIVPAVARGVADRRANVAFSTGAVRIDYAGDRTHAYLRADVLAEDRDNGTSLTHNSTGTGSVALGVTRELRDTTLSATAWHTIENFHATFSSVTNARNNERLTSTQSVPAHATGVAVYARRAKPRWQLLSGADATRAEGYSQEVFFPALTAKTTGSALTQGGAFAQASFAWRRVQLYSGVRAEHATRDGNAWTPTAGAAYGAGHWRVHASGYRAFRAPTLNELYRDFRVGNAVTLANAALRPETMTGVDAGVEYRHRQTRLSASVFRNELDALITNVTLSSAPAQITRQRANASSAVSRGVQVRIAQDIGALRAEAAWLFADSRSTNGTRLAQVPRHQGSAQTVWRRASTMLAIGVRASSLQFEDDLNLYALSGYAVWHAGASRTLRAGVALHVEIENALDRNIVAGYSPTPLNGAPQLWRAGLRWSH